MAVKGDPVSQTALLSTTIQLAMVVSRMLDRLNDPTSMGFYGQKIFAFTDDLDVANRLYYQILMLREEIDLVIREQVKIHWLLLGQN